MEFKQLEAFAAVVNLGSFSKAGDRLFLTLSLIHILSLYDVKSKLSRKNIKTKSWADDSQGNIQVLGAACALSIQKAQKGPRPFDLGPFCAAYIGRLSAGRCTNHRAKAIFTRLFLRYAAP